MIQSSPWRGQHSSPRQCLSIPGPIWSLATLDAIDKAEYLLFCRDGQFQPSPHISIQLHGCTTDALEDPQSFLPYVQPVFMVVTRKRKRKLDDHAILANNIKCRSKDTYQIYRRDRKSITSVRKDEFVLVLEQNDSRSDIRDVPSQLQTQPARAFDAIHIASTSNLLGVLFQQRRRQVHDDD